MLKKGEKLYIVRKMVFAKDANDALKRAKKVKATEAFVHADWEKENILRSDAIGFIYQPSNDYEE